MGRYNAFESWIIKIQRGQENQLNRYEKCAVSALLKESVPSGTSISFGSPIAERLAKFRKLVQGQQLYIERLCIMGKYVIPDNRKSMTPQLFKAMLFLKANKRVWDAELFGKVINGVRNENAEAKTNAHNIHSG